MARHKISHFGIFYIIPIWYNVVKGISMRLKELRKSRKISQVKLAMDLNMNQNTISRYETGEREPGVTELILLADYFDVSIDYLVGRTDRRTGDEPNMPCD